MRYNSKYMSCVVCMSFVQGYTLLHISYNKFVEEGNVFTQLAKFLLAR